MTTVAPYLIFNGNCRDAMAFYQQCLGGEIALQSVEESPMADQWPAAMQQGILHASLTNKARVIMASDMHGPEEIKPGNAVAIALNCSTAEELRTYFNSLSKGGKATRPVHEFFNGSIGALTDPFGVDWVLYAPKENSQTGEKKSTSARK